MPKPIFNNLVFLFSENHNILRRYIEHNGGIVTTDINAYYEVAMFVPGPDISPFLYGEKKLKSTTVNFSRDLRDIALFRKIDPNVPKIGINRGAQFLNVMNGGGLIQHVDRHIQPHEIMDLMTGNLMLISSHHHQMMEPSKLGALLAVANAANKKQSEFRTEYIDNDHNQKNNIFKDVEVIWYESTKSLCYQPTLSFDNSSVSDKNSREYFADLFEDWVAPSIKNWSK